MRAVEVSKEAVGLPPMEIPFSVRKGSKKAFAKHLRKNPTRSEEVLRDALSNLGYKFQFQVIVNGYIPDFLFRKKRIIELDGAAHIGREEYDRNRDTHLKDAGYTILRLPSRMVFQDMDSILNAIEKFIGKPPKPRNRKRDCKVEPAIVKNPIKETRKVKVIKKETVVPKGERTFNHTWTMNGRTWTVSMVGDAQGDKMAWRKFLQSLDAYSELITTIGLEMELKNLTEGI